MLAAQKLAASISEFRPLDEQELAKDQYIESGTQRGTYQNE